ncbi:VOC family protein [Luminiphilus syltensis]|uniref:VOC family protein n=1 Tax=Luminiphilus syltensis TaxID=1341119 RepID=UPI0002D57829|nr:VOC family protein [Luminiphilus syltensis]
MPTIVKPIELGIVVGDLATSVPFYRDLLGLAPERDITISAEIGERTGVAANGFSISRLTAPCGAVVKLLERQGLPSAPGQLHDEICARATQSFLTLVIDDLDGIIKKLQEAGVKARSDPAIVDVRPGMRLAFIVDPDGYPIELVEYSAN